MSKIYIGKGSILTGIVMTKQKRHYEPQVTEEELNFVIQAILELASKMGLQINVSNNVSSQLYDFDGESYSKKEDVTYERLLERYKGSFNFHSLPIWDCEYIFSQLKKLKSLKINSVEYTPARIDVILEKILDRPEEFYQKVAAELSPEEYYFLESLIQSKKCSNCSKQDCDKRENDVACHNWHNSELVGKAKLMKK